jgi:hypothetical protein
MTRKAAGCPSAAHCGFFRLKACSASDLAFDVDTTPERNVKMLRVCGSRGSGSRFFLREPLAFWVIKACGLVYCLNSTQTFRRHAPVDEAALPASAAMATSGETSNSQQGLGKAWFPLQDERCPIIRKLDPVPDRRRSTPGCPFLSRPSPHAAKVMADGLTQRRC